MGERDGIAGANAKGTAAREVVHRPRDQRKPHVVEIPQRRRDGPWQRAVNESLQEDRLKPVLPVV